MNDIKDQQARDMICRSHSVRSERDLYRVCPSKLSKRELENLYFALLENNLELKKTLHSQQEKLKVLSTKVQRMTAIQRNAAGKEKDCCASKALVNEQKEMIFELKKTNDRMAERIRLLNMRLCSAKQFLKRSPSQMSKCPKCARCSTAPVSFKNSSTSALMAKLSEVSIKTNTVSSQYIAKDAPQPSGLTQPVGTETDLPEKEVISERECNENKCRTLMDDLKQRTVHLQEELSDTHSEYSERISKLEAEVSSLQAENVRARSERLATEHALQRRDRAAAGLQGKLRDAEGTISDLTMQLTIERRKVTELKTNLKLANMSNQMAKTIENMNNIQQEKLQAATDGNGVCPVCLFCSVKRDTEVDISPEKELRSPSLKPKEDSKFSKSDDSGYTDLNRSCETEEDKAMERLNHDLLIKRIVELQTQLDGLRIKSAGESALPTNQQNLKYDENYEAIDDHKTRNGISITVGEERPDVVLEMERLNEKQFKDLVEKDVNTSTPIKDKENERNNDEGRDTDPGVSCKDQIAECTTRSNENLKHQVSNKIETLNFFDDTSRKGAIYSRNIISNTVPDSYTNMKDKKKLSKNGENTSKETEKNGSLEERNVKMNETNKENNLYHDAQCTTSKEIALAIEENRPKVDKSTIDTKEISKKAKSEPETQDHKKITGDVQAMKLDIGNQNHNSKTDDVHAEKQDHKDKTGDVQLEKLHILIGKQDDKGGDVQPGKLDILVGKQDHKGKIGDVQPGKLDILVGKQDHKGKTDDVCAEKRDHKGKTSDIQSEKLDINKTDGKLDSDRVSTSLYHEKEIIDPMKIAHKGFTNEDVYSAENVKPKEVAKSVDGKGAPELSKPSELTIRPFFDKQDSSSTLKNIPFDTSVDDGMQMQEKQSTPTSVARRDSATYSATPAPAARRPSATYTAAPSRRPSATYTAAPSRRPSATFTPPAPAGARGSSPENTDHEISSLSDLPPERDETSPRDVLSPGEARAAHTDTGTSTGTGTGTGTGTRRITDYGSLSEGELPAPERARKLSFGEKSTYYCNPETSSAQMEATLRAIGEELARCRALLGGAGPHAAVRCSTLPF